MNKIDNATQDHIAHVKKIKLNKRLTDIYKDDKVKPVYTPEELADEMISKLPNLDGEILVVSDLGLLVAVLRTLKIADKTYEQVIFIAHNEEQQTFSQNVGVKTIQIGYNKPIEEMEKQLVGLKFDIIVANPPYGNLHLKIMKKAVEHLTENGMYLSIQPVRWLQDPLWRVKKTTDAKKMFEILNNKIENIEVISSKDAGRIFNASFGMDLGIFILKNNGGKYSYDTLSNTSKGIDMQPFSKMLIENNFKLDAWNSSMMHFVTLMTIDGGGGSGNRTGTFSPTRMDQNYGYFTFSKSNNCKYGDGLTLPEAHKANRRRTVGKTEGAIVKQFNTAEESKNFYDYIRLDAFRFFIYVTTLDVNIQCKFLPFPSEPDAFTKSWDNEKFFSYWNIEKSEQVVIENTMKEFPLNG